MCFLHIFLSLKDFIKRNFGVFASQLENRNKIRPKPRKSFKQKETYDTGLPPLTNSKNLSPLDILCVGFPILLNIIGQKKLKE